MNATEQIRKEHRYILGTLKTVATTMQGVSDAYHVKQQDIESILRYFKEFVTDQHMVKEEKGVFAKLAEAGLPTEAGALVLLHREHGELRRSLKKLDTLAESAKLEETGAHGALARAMLEFCNQLENHIDKEETVLLPIAEMVFSNDDQASALRLFKRVERRSFAYSGASNGGIPLELETGHGASVMRRIGNGR